MSNEDKNAQLFLNTPKTEKELDHGESFAFGGIQGWRSSNEDYHKHLIPLNSHSWKHWSYFAIFDGHNGTDTAQNASNLLDKHLIEALNELKIRSNNSKDFDLEQLNIMIQKTFLQLDKELIDLVEDQSGSVCIASLISPDDIYLINLGDSRAILLSDNGEVLEYTKDHKPSVSKEKERIRKAGGQVTQHGHDVARVDEILAVSRALGDYSMDKNVISAKPDLIHHSRKCSSASYLILACDGLWDVMSNEQVAIFFSKRVSHTSLQDIASQLLDKALKLETTDNVSIYILKL